MAGCGCCPSSLCGAAANEATASRWRNFRWLVLCVVIIHSDQNLLAPNMSACAADLDLDSKGKDDMGGLLAFGLFVVGGPGAIIVGILADSGYNRVFLLFGALIIGAIGCAATAASASLVHLFVARALTGVCLGSALPLAFSIIGDMFDETTRTALSGRIGLAMVMGTVCGQGLGGWLGPVLGWRAPFIVISLCMASLAAAVSQLMSDPPRAEPKADAATQRTRREILMRGCCTTPIVFQPHSSIWARLVQLGYCSSLLRVPTVLLVFLQGVPGCVPWGVLAAFLPDFLHVNSGLSVHQATIVMSCFAAGSACGQTLAGEAGQLLYNYSKRMPAVLMLFSGSAGTPPMMWLLRHASHRTMTSSCVVASVGGFFAAQTGPVIRATLSNVTNSEQRGIAFAAFAIFDDLGKGFGPVAIAALIRALGRARALELSMLLWVPCALCNGAIALTVVGDEARVRQRSALKLSNEEFEPLMQQTGSECAEGGSSVACQYRRMAPHSSEGSQRCR